MPVRRRSPIYSPSGLLRCHHCGGSFHLHRDKGWVRAYCYQGRQGVKYPRRPAFLEIYETRLLDHPATFTIPADCRPKLMAAQAAAHSSVSDVGAERRRLERQLDNLRTLFSPGDVSKDELLERCGRLQQSLLHLRADAERDGALERAAMFLTDLPAAWRAGSDARRNALARLLFEEVKIKDDWIAAVWPQSSFAPFFDLDCQARRLSGGSDGIRTRDLSLDRAAC